MCPRIHVNSTGIDVGPGWAIPTIFKVFNKEAQWEPKQQGSTAGTNKGQFGQRYRRRNMWERVAICYVV
jgi:hypothetical protein